VAGDSSGPDPAADARIRQSPYGDVLGLARRLARGQPTTYDVVRSIERHLRRNYAYSEQPPAREHPLAAFLLEDRTGYCQQFSGAMALMLRMNGIPARVATGFAPGVREPGGRWRVRDLDAHSWVEVHFTGVGWVAFDPTPASAPAERPAEDDAQADAAPSASPPETEPSRPSGPEPSAGGAGSQEAEPSGESADGVGSSPPTALTALAALLALLAGAMAVGWRHRSAARRTRPRSLEDDVNELRTALDRFGYELSPHTTLAALEGSLAARAGPGAARYARRLRERRYGAPEPALDPRLDRRALRTALVAGRGPLVRLRGFLALPPTALRARR
jgi:hypothetical protein